MNLMTGTTISKPPLGSCTPVQGSNMAAPPTTQIIMLGNEILYKRGQAPSYAYRLVLFYHEEPFQPCNNIVTQSVD